MGKQSDIQPNTRHVPGSDGRIQPGCALSGIRNRMHQLDQPEQGQRDIYREIHDEVYLAFGLGNWLATLMVCASSSEPSGCDQGDPAEVLQMVEAPVPRFRSWEVVVEVHASSINPADYKMIQVTPWQLLSLHSPARNLRLL